MWAVKFSGRVKKQTVKLPPKVRDSFKLLIKELQLLVPVLPQWPNFAKISGESQCYHCHLKKGRSTYVAIWQAKENEIKVIEVRYVGPHESADYSRLC